MKTNSNLKQQGFTLVEIMIVVAVIGLLAAIGIPSFMRARDKSLNHTKIANCRQIEGAIAQYAMDEGCTNGVSVEWCSIAAYLRDGDLTDYNVGREQIDSCSLRVGATVVYRAR